MLFKVIEIDEPNIYLESNDGLISINTKFEIFESNIDEQDNIGDIYSFEDIEMLVKQYKE